VALLGQVKLRLMLMGVAKDSAKDSAKDRAKKDTSFTYHL